MRNTALTEEECDRYAQDGYLLIKEMLSRQEIELLGKAAREDRILDQHSYARADGEGGTVGSLCGTIRPELSTAW